MKRHQAGTAVIIVLAGMFLTAGAMAAQEKAADQEKQAAPESKVTKENFSGVLLLWSGPMAGRSTRVQITVTNWTSDEEKTELYKALTEGGSDALLKAMRKKKVGYIRSTNSLSYNLNIASSFQTEKGRTIRLVTERPITFVEAMTSTRSEDYEFGVIEFTLDEKGKGEGVILPTAKVSINQDGKLEVEVRGTGPQKFLNIKKDK